MFSTLCVDLDNNGYISDYELNELLKEAGHQLPGYMVREIIQKLDRDKDNRISFEEFLAVSEVEIRKAQPVQSGLCSLMLIKQRTVIRRKGFENKKYGEAAEFRITSGQLRCHFWACCVAQWSSSCLQTRRLVVQPSGPADQNAQL